MSAATKLMPSRPLRMVRSSRVLQPPVSGPLSDVKHFNVVEFVVRTRCTSGRAKGRIQCVDINADIDRVFQPNTLFDFLDDSLSTNGVDLSGLHNFKSAVAVVLVITGTTQGGANTSVDIAVGAKKTLLSSMIEIGSYITHDKN